MPRPTAYRGRVGSRQADSENGQRSGVFVVVGVDFDQRGLCGSRDLGFDAEVHGGVRSGDRNAGGVGDL